MPQTVSTLVNGKKVGQTQLADGFQSYEVVVPAAALRSGENRIEFLYAYSESPPPGAGGVVDSRSLAVAWDWIGFGTSVPPPGPEPKVIAQSGAFSFPFHNRLDFYLEVHPQSRIRWQAIRPWRTSRLDPAASLEVQVELDDGSPERTFRVQPGSFASPQDLALANERTSLARVSFLPLPGRSAPGGVTGLTLLAPELCAAGCAGAEEGEDPDALSASGPARPNVLFYLIDTLRADHLGVYGYPRPTSPNIDRFAAEAALFTRAFAQSGWTKSAAASMLTGLTPLSHSVMGRADALPDSLRLLPERLRDLGYETVGITTNPNTSAEFGFSRGYDHYLRLFDVALEYPNPDSDKVNEELFRWLGARDRRKPFFAFLHTVDPHEPYTPPEPYRHRFAPRTRTGIQRPRPEDVSATLAAHPGLRERDLKGDLEALYDGEIAHNDAQFGLLLRKLRELGLYDNTLIVLLSDHGEEFLDHGYWAHGHSLYREILHVPLIIRFPGGQYAGRRVEPSVQHIDLVPTVLGIVGIQIPPDLPGMDLRAFASGATTVEREVSSDLDLDETEISSLVAHGMHLLEWERPDPKVELYDIRSDWRELLNVADKPDVRFGYLTNRLRTLHRLQSGRTEPKRVTIPPELEKHLRALGYIR